MAQEMPSPIMSAQDAPGQAVLRQVSKLRLVRHGRNMTQCPALDISSSSDSWRPARPKKKVSIAPTVSHCCTAMLTRLRMGVCLADKRPPIVCSDLANMHVATTLRAELPSLASLAIEHPCSVLTWPRRLESTSWEWSCGQVFSPPRQCHELQKLLGGWHEQLRSSLFR
eukprot:4645532-Amphidinium_carterae.2